MIKKYMLWIWYFIFVAVAITFKGEEALFTSNGPYGLGKTLTWLIFISFLSFSLYCTYKENFYRSVRNMMPAYWFRQISFDLYIGMLFSAFIIYLNEGSLLFIALWALPLLLFANLATLLYIAMNYDSLIARFIS